MQYTRTPCPGLNPLVLVLVESVDVGELGQGGHGRLFRRLACEETSGVLGEDDADGEVGVVCKRGDDEYQFYDRDGTAGGEKKVRFPILER